MNTSNAHQLKEDRTPSDPSKAPVRHYDAKYAIIYANEHYDKLRSLDKTMGNLKWTKDDLMRSRATVSMMDIPPGNILELIDSTREQLNILDKELMKKVQKHA